MRLVLQRPGLADAIVTEVDGRLARPGRRSGPDLAFWDDAPIDAGEARALAALYEVDAALIDPARTLADYRLIVFDMDSTLITIECIDEIADYAGRKQEVAAITAAAMRGEIADYDESLRRRVALLAGTPLSALQSVYDDRLRLSPGAQTLIAAVKRAGLKVLLVSGGFTYFTGRLQTRLGIDFCRSNELGVADGRLTGQVHGEIVNASVKRRLLLETCAQIGCRPDQAIAVGDGANDLLMMHAAGVSVAYHAKPVVQAQASHALNHCGLDAVLNLFG